MSNRVREKGGLVQGFDPSSPLTGDLVINSFKVGHQFFIVIT